MKQRSFGELSLAFIRKIEINGYIWDEFLVASQNARVKIQALNDAMWLLLTDAQRRRLAQRMVRDAKWDSYIRRFRGDDR